MDVHFQKVAKQTSNISGTPLTFGIATLIVIIWILLGPAMYWSDTWQLIISSISSVITFLMVFLIQYAQNKDTKALQLKLDELIRSNNQARNDLVKIEREPEEKLNNEIQKIEKQTTKKKGE